MSPILRFLQSRLQREDGTLSSGQIIAWWERLRWVYNVTVGLAGLLTISVAILSTWVAALAAGMPFEFPDPPIFVVIYVMVYGSVANIFYTGGWVLEILLTKICGRSFTVHAQSTFVVGTLFSVALTLLPALVGLLGLVLMIIFRSQD